MAQGKDGPSIVSFFGGKVVVLYLIDASPDFEGGVPILDPMLKEMNGRYFVVGIAPSMVDDWSSGQTVGVAVDQIAHFIAFTSEQEFLEWSASWYLGDSEPN